jgi:hypothetical protein
VPVRPGPRQTDPAPVPNPPVGERSRSPGEVRRAVHTPLRTPAHTPGARHLAPRPAGPRPRSGTGWRRPMKQGTDVDRWGNHAKGRHRARDRSGAERWGCAGRARAGAGADAAAADRQPARGDPGDRGRQQLLAQHAGVGADLPAGPAGGAVAAGPGADAGPGGLQRLLRQPPRGRRHHPGRDLRPPGASACGRTGGSPTGTRP